MSHSGKLTPNLDQNGTKLLNLTVLQRIDSFIEEILMTAAHVTFYEFNIDGNQWSRKDVEGSLFVVKRNAQPRFQFIVMNRRNTDNLVENLLGDFEFEVQIPYLLYRNASQEVNGIWFYNSRECEEVASLFTRILSAYQKVLPKPQISSSKSEFEELEKAPTMAVMEGPLEPSPATTSSATGVPEDPSFVNFFSGAMNIGKPSNVVNPGQNYHVPVNVPSHIPTVVPSPAAPVLDTVDPVSSNSRVANLLKPSSFFQPTSASGLMMPPISLSTPTSALNNPLTMQRSYGTPVLQPFPPPTPPSTFAAVSTPPSYGAVINKDKVRDALLTLVQDNQFIDKFYQTLMKSHST